MIIELKAGQDDNGRRLDRILRKALPDHSLSLIHRLLRQGKVLVNGNKARQEQRIESGEIIRIQSTVNMKPKAVNKNQPSCDALPPILFQGAGIIVFNKPAGMTTHGHHSLSNLVGNHLSPTLPHSLSFKPGPLHRLDKPTSGIIAFSTTLNGAQLFSRLLRERRLAKTYLAIVEGRMSGSQTWEDQLVRDTTAKKTYAAVGGDSQNALAQVTPVSSNEKYTLIEVEIITGRTHQIRAQAAAHGHPLAGDKKYGGHGAQGFFLHAWKIELDRDDAEIPDDFPRLIIAPLPELFQSQINDFFD